jgi:hypothetical protein
VVAPISWVGSRLPGYPFVTDEQADSIQSRLNATGSNLRLVRRRSGVATAVLTVIVAVIIVIAAVAAYIDLSTPNAASSTTSSTSSTTNTTSQATTSSTSSISTTSSVLTSSTTLPTASVNTTCLESQANATSVLPTLYALTSTQDVLNLLGTYSSMAVQLNDSSSTTGNSSLPESTLYYAYDTVYVSATTYKVNVSVGIGSVGNLNETFWILRDGSLLATYIATSEVDGTSIPGTNLTASSDQALAGSTFAIFQEVAHPTNLTAYTNPAKYHVSGTSTEDIGKIQMNVNTYVPNVLPETFNECGLSTSISAFALQLGTPQGSNASLLVDEHIAASDEINGSTIASEIDFRLLTIAAATSPPTTSGAWTLGSPYPAVADGVRGITDQTCLNQSSTIYCIGGTGNNGTTLDNVYSASVSSSGMSAWKPQAPYPIPSTLISCATYDGNAYCVGGITGNGSSITDAAYFAPLTSAGIGSWQSTTPYPDPIAGASCTASSGYIYCVAGENATGGSSYIPVTNNSAWYAQISSSGIGTWQKTTAYPHGIQFPVCTATATDFYCFGGYNSNSIGVDNVFYASLTSSGIGQWKNTTSYPLPLEGEFCVADSGDVICVGGSPNSNSLNATQAVYYAPITAIGLGTWQQGPSYPVPINTYCAFAAGNIYCIGGLSSSSDIWSDFVFFAPVESLVE